MSAATWNLLNIRNKVRNLTGTPSTDQLTDNEINDYIDKYYVFTMPHELKEQIQNQPLQFKTLPGQDVYAFPAAFLTNSPGAYADGFPLIFYQDPDVFYQDWPIQYAVDNIGTGDGLTVNYTGGLLNPPLIRGSLFISDGTQTAQDDGLGNLLINNVISGGINYITGAYTVTFPIPPVASATLLAKYQGYQGARPQGILFFNNVFTVRSVPDQVYQILMQGFVVPTSFFDPITGVYVDTRTPAQQEWGQLIAYGAALDILADRGDIDAQNSLFPSFKRFENVALGRTVQQFTIEQSVPRF